jgi:hypothetical protein
LLVSHVAMLFNVMRSDTLLALLAHCVAFTVKPGNAALLPTALPLLSGST